MDCTKKTFDATCKKCGKDSQYDIDSWIACAGLDDWYEWKCKWCGERIRKSGLRIACIRHSRYDDQFTLSWILGTNEFQEKDKNTLTEKQNALQLTYAQNALQLTDAQMEIEELRKWKREYEKNHNI